MATFTTFLNMRKADNGDSANVLTDIDAAFTTLDSLFDPAALSVTQAPRVVMRETVHNPTYVGPANTIDLRPVWNAPSSTLRGLFIDATHTGAGASSRVVEVRRSGNPIWDVDITTQNAVNGLSMQGGAAGQPAKIVAIGTDTNIGIALVPKGSGQVSFGATGVLSVTQLTLTTPVSKIIPGATSLSLRNNADTADNVLVADAGDVSVRGNLTLSNGALLMDAVVSRIRPGATSFAIRDNNNANDNLLVSNAGAVTVRASLTVTAGNVGVGAAPTADTGLLLSPTTTTNTTQQGAQISPTFSAAATALGLGLYVAPTTAAAAFTLVEANGVQVAAVGKGAGSTITTVKGINVRTQTAGATNNYGVYIEAPSGGSGDNLGLVNLGAARLGTTASISSSTNPSANTGLLLSPTTTGATGHTGLSATPQCASDATVLGRAIFARVDTAAVAFTMASAYGVQVASPNKGAGSTVTEVRGVYVQSQTAGGTNNYGVYIEAPSGGSGANRGLFVDGDVQFGQGIVALGGGAAPTLGTIGGSGPATAAQNGWKKFVDSTGAGFWVPVWK
jgi:hypothetical protein